MIARPVAQQIPAYCDAGESPGACLAGVSVITGTIASKSASFLPTLYPNPVVLLIDVASLIARDFSNFVPESGQILGRIAEPMFPGPGEAQIQLPIVPSGQNIDLDNDADEDAGVQVFALQMASNLVLDSYLQQLEQDSGLASYLIDVRTGAITEGTFLLHAPDADQGFPASWGEDGLWFTADDPATPLPAGYTVAILGADGTVTLDRSPVVAMNAMEREEAKALDFSDEGILQSFNLLIDALTVRYAYTELRGLDWNEMRARYLDDVTQADAKDDFVAYYLVLTDLAQSMQDSHVSAKSTDPRVVIAPLERYRAQMAGTLGAATVAVTAEATGEIGDRVYVLSVGEGTPAAKAGWTPGTEILSVNGEPTASRLGEVPLLLGLGTAEGRRVLQAASLLSFPLSDTVSIGYRLPGASDSLTATMVAGEYETGFVAPDESVAAPITFEQIGDYAVIRWSDFVGYIVPKIAVLEEALSIEQQRATNGVIIDLRGNGGGWVTLYETMASYFFGEDHPMPVHLFDFYFYDLQAGEHVPQFAVDYEVSAPRADLTYTGPVVVLVDNLCASACEYFTQHLQLLDRAVVVGQYATSGAGGFIDQITLPGQIKFQYTQGGSFFAGTDEPNLEAKGVIPDIRVPVTVETELAKRRGEDPVLEAALEYLNAQSERITQNPWRWIGVFDPSQVQTAIDTPDAYSITFGEDGTVTGIANCNVVSGTYSLGDADEITITLDNSEVQECGGDSQSRLFLAALSGANMESYEGDALWLVTDPETGVLALIFEPAK